jgi:uncharacterized protein with FMN-binding domain
MPRKIPRRLVALSASAIAAVYFAGFAATQAADAGIASAATTVPTATTQTSSNPASATASAPSVTTYRDGTYSGTGSSRRGNVSVSLTVSGRRITNVSITGVTTEYPVSRIAALPTQVLASQSSQVNNVTGATYSAQAFRLAVQAALAQASA